MQIRQNQSFSAQTLRTHRHLFWECWGVVLLVKGAWVRDFAAMLEWDADFLTLMLAGALCNMACLVDITAPSVSLEGKSLWLAQSLPILPW